MGDLTFAKQVALSTGLFRPANTLYRTFNRFESARFQQEYDFYSNLLQPDSLCFDVGANIGKKSEIYLELGTSVVAFEPQPDCAREIQARCSRFSNRIQICQNVLGKQPGEATLHLKKSKGQSSLLDDWEGQTEGQITVSMITLDQAIAQYGQPDYCKIDVEGYEFEVLQGLTHKIPLLSFEYHLRDREIETALSCLAYLARLGEYRVNLIPSDAMEFTFAEWLSPDTFLREFPDKFKSQENYFYGEIFVKFI